MRDVIELDSAERWARVQAGVVNVELTVRLRRARTCSTHPTRRASRPARSAATWPRTPAARTASSTAATTRHILGLVIVRRGRHRARPLSGPIADPDGYDLVGLFVGSEGMFGLATEVTVRAHAGTRGVETMLAMFRLPRRRLRQRLRDHRRALEPSALEILDKLTIQAVEDSVFAAGYPREAEAVLLIDVEGSRSRSRRTTVRSDPSSSSARTAPSRSARAADARRAQEALGRPQGRLRRHGPRRPRPVRRRRRRAAHQAARARRGTTEICREKRDLKLANVFHAGDGNLHPNICYDRRDPAEVAARARPAGHEIMQLCIEAGGSLTGEHGVGLEKLAEMELAVSPSDDLGAMCAGARRLGP